MSPPSVVATFPGELLGRDLLSCLGVIQWSQILTESITTMDAVGGEQNILPSQMELGSRNSLILDYRVPLMSPRLCLHNSERLPASLGVLLYRALKALSKLILSYEAL